MSIVPCYGSMRCAICDCCGEELPATRTFDGSVDAKKDAGWKSQKQPDGSWMDLCPECQDKPGDVFRKG